MSIAILYKALQQCIATMSVNLNKPLTRASSTSTVNTHTTPGRKDDSNAVMTVNDLWIKMQTMFTQSNERLEAKIDSCMDRLNNRMDVLEVNLSASKQECGDNIAAISEQVDHIRSDIFQTNRRMDVFGTSSELVISGIPYLQTEDLRQAFRNIAIAIGYLEDSVPTTALKRLSRHPIVPGTAPPILCEFALRTARDDFCRTICCSVILVSKTMIAYTSMRTCLLQGDKFGMILLFCR